MPRLAAITILVPDYDEAIAWFRDALGLAVAQDRPMGPDKRWVVMRGAAGASIIVAKASDAAQRARIGDATGGRVAYFLHTDDFARDHLAMLARGVRFLDPPRVEDYGTVAVFADPWGGKWDLLEPSAPPEGDSPG